MENLKKRNSDSKWQLLNTAMILICMLLCAVKCCGCVSASTKGETIIRSHKGFYPCGCVVNSPDGRVDNFPTRTYVLSEEAYRAILMGE